MLAALDDAVGGILSAIRSEGLERSTLVFFLSDNGGEPAVLGTTNGPHRGQKFDVLEGGIRVPFVLRWPGVVPPGVRYPKMVHAVDVFATALAAAGVRIPEGTDGVDLLPFVSGRAAGAPHDRLFWLFNDHKEWRIPGRDTNLARPLRAVREDSFKLVMEGDRAPELYDLARDPGETNNLAAAQPERVDRLKRAFDDWRATMKPQVIPDDHPIYGRFRTMASGAPERAISTNAAPPPKPARRLEEPR